MDHPQSIAGCLLGKLGPLLICFVSIFRKHGPPSTNKNCNSLKSVPNCREFTVCLKTNISSRSIFQLPLIACTVWKSKASFLLPFEPVAQLAAKTFSGKKYSSRWRMSLLELSLDFAKITDKDISSISRPEPSTSSTFLAS